MNKNFKTVKGGASVMNWLKGLLRNRTVNPSDTGTRQSDGPIDSSKHNERSGEKGHSQANSSFPDKQSPVLSMPGMTSSNERKWWLNYASETFSGRGAMVDLGSWFGSTTVALAEGLSRNPSEKARKTRIHAFDRFYWEDWMEYSVVATPYEGRFKDGDDFQEVFFELTKAYRDNIVCTKADLTDFVWRNGDIEFLLVDAMKSWELCNSIHASFHPHLMPGVSTLLHQDFAHYYTYWIHLRQYRLRDYFKPLPDTMECNSLAFEYVKKAPDSLLTKALSIDDFTPSEIDDAFAYSKSLVAPVNEPHVEAAHLMAVHARKGKDASIRMHLSLAEKWPDHPVLALVKNKIG